MDEKHNLWRGIIADGMIRLLDGYRRGDIKVMDFVADVTEGDAELNNGGNRR